MNFSAIPGIFDNKQKIVMNNKIYHNKIINFFFVYIRTPPEIRERPPCPIISADVRPRKNAAPIQKKNSIFIHGTLLNT